MPEKSKTKKTDNISNSVKKTKTEVAQPAIRLRWYHVLATIVALSLAVIAIIKIMSRFDISLYGSQYTIKYTIGCTTSFSGKTPEIPDSSFRYAGVKEGDFLGTNGITKDLGDAFVEFVEFGSSSAKIKIRNYATNEWHDEVINFGEQKTTSIVSDPDCMSAIYYSVSQ